MCGDVDSAKMRTDLPALDIVEHRGGRSAQPDGRTEVEPVVSRISRSSVTGSNAPALGGLSNRELELLARGLDNAQIAAHLALAEKTVRNRVSALFDALGVENRSQAIVHAP